ncbi:kelch-like protein 1 [Brienomyrus brachyistius]|nr:kelch-like protein 1 [Brienomyrus brachyistius]
MSTPRHSLGVTAYKGKIYAVGGINRPDHLQTMEVYDPTTNRWHAVAPMSTPRNSASSLEGVLVGSRSLKTKLSGSNFPWPR